MGMFYNYCKLNTQLISHLYYRNIRVIGSENIPENGPVVLAANHPNSFLDAVLIGAAVRRPTHFLARGDAFNNPTGAKILSSLNMLPVYRLSEGKENLTKNTETFDACQEILEANKMVLIFAEGISENNWELRVLKKGPARIAKKAWNSENDAKNLVIVPVGITYEHFSGEGNNILIQFGKPITKEAYDYQKNEALFVKELNEKLSEKLNKLAFLDNTIETDKEAYKAFSSQFNHLLNSGNKDGIEIIEQLHQTKEFKKTIPHLSFIKWSVLFWPFYLFCSWLAPKIVKQKIFLDSIIFGLFIFLWPVYLLLLGGITYLIFNFV